MSVLPTGDVYTTVLRKQHDEGITNVGEDVLLYRAATETSRDLLNDDKTITYTTPVTVPVVIEEVPKKAMLRALKIHIDEDQNLPILGRFRYADEIAIGDVIKLTRKVALDESTSQSGTYFLEVTDMLQESKYSDVLAVAQLAPRREAMP